MNDLELMEEWTKRIKAKRDERFILSLPSTSPLSSESFYSTMNDNKLHHIFKIKDNSGETTWIDGVKQEKTNEEVKPLVRPRKQSKKRERTRAKRRKK